MPTIVEEHAQFLKTGGVFEIEKSVLKIWGPDAADFLHRLTTQNIKAMTPGTGAPGAVLQPNAMMVSLFDLYHCGNFFLIISNRDSGPATAAFFEKFHFAENLEIKDVSADFEFLSVQGAEARAAIQAVLTRAPDRHHEVIGTEDSFVFGEPDFQGPGFHILIKKGQLRRTLDAFAARGFERRSLELWNLMRIEGGFFKFGADLNEKNLILEGAFDEFVSRNKGCYPGQEVIERVFTYGNVAKKLVGLRWPKGATVGTTLRAGNKVFSSDREVGVITSVTHLPWSNEIIGRAIVRKPHYEGGENLRVEGTEDAVTVYRLPHSFDIHREPKVAASV